MVEQSVWWFRRRWRRAAVNGVHQFAVPLPQQGVVFLHLLGEPVRLYAVACGGHELLGERAQHGRDDADDGCQQVLVHIILSLGYGSQGYWSTGSSVLRGHGVVYATLWTDAQFQERFGRAWDNEVFVGVTNGDAAAGLSEGLTTRHTENRLDVMSPTAFTGNVRVNWIVAWGKSVS